MRIGLSYDLKMGVTGQHAVDDALEEYDSPDTVELITAAFESRGHEVVRLGGGEQFLDNVRHEKVDIAFNIAEGRGSHRSREAQIPSILEMLDIPYTGSDPQCLAVCLDKPATKKLVAADDIITPKWLTMASEQELRCTAWEDFPYPAIVKPAYEGSSKGIRFTSLAYSAKQAQKEALRTLECYRQPVMIEEFIDGDEVAVGIIGNNPHRIVGIMRVVPRKKTGILSTRWKLNVITLTWLTMSVPLISTRRLWKSWQNPASRFLKRWDAGISPGWTSGSAPRGYHILSK